MLEKETNYFELKLSELISTDLNKFVLIKGSEIHGTFDTFNDALKSGYEKFGRQAFLVKQILPTQQPLNFANSYFFK